jgi:histidinol-phosphate aminotransferase
VNISSVAGLGYLTHSSPEYSAAKAGLIRFTATLAPLKERMNVRVNCVIPQWIATEHVKATIARMSPEERARVHERLNEPDVICLASPNNPTGLTVEAEAVRALHDRSRALVIVDEAYAEFGGHTAVGLLADLPRLVVVRTFSKAWRLAGARLGYLLGPAWVVDDLRKVRLPYHLDALAQLAGTVALELADDMTAHIRRIAAERERVRAALLALDGVEVFPSEANFLLVRTAQEGLFDRLLDRGVLVRDFSREPHLAGCIRVTIGTEQENDRFVEALEEVLG